MQEGVADVFTVFAEGWIVASSLEEATEALNKVAENKGYYITHIDNMTRFSSKKEEKFSHYKYKARIMPIRSW